MEITLQVIATIENLMPKDKIIDFLQNGNHSIPNANELVGLLNDAQNDEEIVLILYNSEIGEFNGDTGEFLTHCAYDQEQICLFRIYFSL